MSEQQRRRARAIGIFLLGLLIFAAGSYMVMIAGGAT